MGLRKDSAASILSITSGVFEELPDRIEGFWYSAVWFGLSGRDAS